MDHRLNRRYRFFAKCKIFQTVLKEFWSGELQVAILFLVTNELYFIIFVSYQSFSQQPGDANILPTFLFDFVGVFTSYSQEDEHKEVCVHCSAWWHCTGENNTTRLMLSSNLPYLYLGAATDASG